MTDARRRVILDCDPGHDDAMAILLAAASPGIELEGISVVAGNQTLEKCALNARRVCTVAGIDVPIVPGADRPLRRDQVVAADIHGASGLDGPEWPAPTVGLDARHAADFIVERALVAEDRPLTLVAVGPLTNVALALERDPAIVGRIDRISIMGGAIGLGNWTPSAEFNIYADPEAAAAVIGSGIPVTLVPLEVTHRALATRAVIERIAALGSPVAAVSVALMRYFAETYDRVFGFDAPAVHDPCAVAAVIDATIVPARHLNVVVETDAGLHLGRTVVDVHARTGRPPNVDVADGLDIERFWDLMVGALERYGAPTAG